MAKHAWIQENLAAYLAGGLDAEESARLEDHVAGCPNCARDLAETRQADQTLTALFSTALPDAGLEDRLVQSLRKTRAQRFPQLWRYRMIAAAVAAVFLLALVGTLVSGLQKDGGLALPELTSLMKDGSVDLLGYDQSRRRSSNALGIIKTNLDGERASGESAPAGGVNNLQSTFGLELSFSSTNESLGEKAADLGNQLKSRTFQEGKDDKKEALIAGNKTTQEDVLRRQVSGQPSQPYVEHHNVFDAEGKKHDDVSQSTQSARPEGSAGTSEQKLGKYKAELSDSRSSQQSNGRNLAEEDADPFPSELQNSLGYYPPSRGLVVKGASRYHSNLGSEPPIGRGPNSGLGGALNHTNGANPMGGSGGPPIGGGPNWSVANGALPGFGGPGQGFAGLVGGGGINGGIGGGMGGIGGGAGPQVIHLNDKSVTASAVAGKEGKSSGSVTDSSPTRHGGLSWKDAPAGEKLDYFKPNEVTLGKSIANMQTPASGPIGMNDKSSPGQALLDNNHVADLEHYRGAKVPQLGTMPADGALRTPQLAQNKNEKDEKKPAEGEAAASRSAASQPPKEALAPRKIIIRTGEMDFEVESFDAATTVITLLVNPIPGAFIATTNSEKLPNGKVRGSVVVRCPPEHLDALVAGLRSNLAKSHGELKSQRIGSQDITKQYTDLESRLRAARTMQERLLQIIKTGKGEVKDLLNVEKELAVWGTKIEEMEGELRYFAHQVALSTLTITLTEKEIKAPYGVLDTERINMGIEVEDVETAQTQTLAIVADVKGRITKSELKRLDAGQFNSVINFEVPPDAAGPVRDRLKQLGNVARFDANRVMETEGGTGKPLDGKVTRKDAQFFLSLYNLANVAPREVTNFDVVSTDAETAYQALLDRVQKLGGRIVTSNLNRQNNDQTVGTLSFQVKANEADALLQELKAIGEVLKHQTVESPDTQNTTRSKRGFLVQILAMGAVPSRETTTMQLATADVPTSYHKLREAIVAAKGRMLSAQLNEQSRQNATASLDFEVRRDQEQAVRTALASVGDALSRNVTRVPENETALNSKVRLQVTLLDAARVPPREATSLGIETADVDAATSLFTSIVRDAGGRTAEAHAARERDGKVTARLIFYVPLAAAAEVVDRFKSAGVVRVQEKERNPQVADGPLAVARIDVTLSNSDLILAPDQGMWPQIRKGLTTSFVGLSWSLTVVIIGALFVLPWALVVYAAYRIVRWMRRVPRSA
jgi:hypothetical protein